MTDKIRLAVLCGGRSSEHEVSVMSARSMIAAIDQERYELSVIGISREGQWYSGADHEALLAHDRIESASASDLVPVSMRQSSLVAADAGPAGVSFGTREFDVVFPLLHGPYGEDGTVQGLLELADVAYVGSGVLGSATAMDKDIANRLFLAAGLRKLPYRCLRRHEWQSDRSACMERLCRDLAFPMFVKPANAGSSVGVSKVKDRAQLESALDAAAQFDTKLIIEQDAGDCYEVECGVLGAESARASVVGEIIPANEFYDYADKYIDGATDFRIPAALPEAVADEVRSQALAAFYAVEAFGLARVDFFVEREGHGIYINEINTMPGFTPISMYPKLWAATGLSYSALIDELVSLALARHAERRELKLTI